MLRYGEDRWFTSRRGASYQNRLAGPVFAVAHARTKRVIRMVDAHAAARMELRGMPGALACLSATGQDAGAKLTDDEMGHLLSESGASSRPAPPPGPMAKHRRAPTAKSTIPSTQGTPWCAALHGGDVTRTHTAIARLLAEARVQCGVELDRLRGMEPWVGGALALHHDHAPFTQVAEDETYLSQVLASLPVVSSMQPLLTCAQSQK